MTSQKYVDCELFLTSRDHAILSVAGREYSGRPTLDASLERRLLEAELEPVRYGTELFEALFHEGDGLLVGYRESLTVARHEGKRLRLRLHIAEAAPLELHKLHWELLYDPRRKIALARSQETAFSRYLGVSVEPTQPVASRPRLLVVLASPQDLADFDLPEINRDEMRRALDLVLTPLVDLMTVEILEGPATIERIRDRLVAGRFHALHLVAHGVLSPGEQKARLMLEASDGSAKPVSEEVFSEVFDGQRELRLISLIACHGGAVSGSDPFTGLGPALIDRGVSAVVAMRRQIGVGGATCFTEHFYRNLARSGRIDAAVNEARLQLYFADSESPNWSTPALFMRLAEGRLWQPSSLEEATESNVGKTSGVLVEPEGTPPTGESGQNAPVVRTLVVSELVGRPGLAKKLGDERMAELFGRYDRIARDLLDEHMGEQAERASRFLMLFERPLNAVRWALAFHGAMAELSVELGVEVAFRIGVHLGEVVLIEDSAEGGGRGTKPMAVEGQARPIAGRLTSLAQAGQTLLSAAAFDLARRSVVGTTPHDKLSWLAHGEYVVEGFTLPLAVFEVGIEGASPLSAPSDSSSAQRAAGDLTIVGWRPGVSLEVPQRPRWVLEKKLSEGGFGEVWLARHEKLREQRVFKFCFEIERLRALQREITLFRLLKEELGDRHDIARILDWNFEQAPYFIESEYAADGNLLDWAEDQGGIAAVPIEQRLEIIVQLATALSAAHSVGVLHKDVKPANVLIASGPDDALQVRLADFGIGTVTARGRLEAAGITVLGLTAKTEEKASSYSGTRLYMAPEVLEGKRATLQSDIYALGVIFYQIVVGDFTRALAPGWRRDVNDDLLCEDVALAVDGSPKQRLGNALRIAERLQTLEGRRNKRESELRERVQARQIREALERSRRRNNWVVVAIAVLSLFAGTLMVQKRRISREAETARQVSEFLVRLFKVSDPSESLGNSITAREILDRGAESIDQELRDQPEIQARLMDTMGRVYQNLGLYNDALPLLERALETRRQIYSDEAIEVAESLGRLAHLQMRLGKYEEAETLCREALALRKPGTVALDVAEYMDTLGSVLGKKSDLDGAEFYFREALEIRRQMLGEEHQAIANSLNNLGKWLHAKGDHQEAEKAFREALRMQRSLLGGSHPDIAVTLNDLARLLKTAGGYDEAEQLYRETLDMRRRLLGDEHSDVASTMNNLAELLRAKGSYEEAESLYRSALGMHRKILGDEHPLVAWNLNNLATMFKVKGDFESAELLYREALAMRRNLFGDGHSAIASSLNNLALLLNLKGDYDSAEPLFRESLELVRELFGEEHLYVAAALNNLGDSLRLQGDLQSAEELLRESLFLRRKLVGNEHPVVALSLNNLALLAQMRGDIEVAKELFLKALAMRRSLLGSEHADVAQSQNRLARCLVVQGEFLEAKRLAESALVILRKVLPEGHWKIASVQSVLGASLKGLGRYNDAEPLLLGSYAILRKQRGDRAWSTRDTLGHIIDLYEVLGEVERGAEYRALVQGSVGGPQ